MKRTKILDMYLFWVNDYLTLTVFAETYNIDVETAGRIISIGAKLNQKLIVKNRQKPLMPFFE